MKIPQWLVRVGKDHSASTRSKVEHVEHMLCAALPSFGVTETGTSPLIRGTWQLTKAQLDAMSNTEPMKYGPSVPNNYLQRQKGNCIWVGVTRRAQEPPSGPHRAK